MIQLLDLPLPSSMATHICSSQEPAPGQGSDVRCHRSVGKVVDQTPPWYADGGEL